MEDIQPQEGTREFGLSSWSVTNRTTVFVLMAIIIIRPVQLHHRSEGEFPRGGDPRDLHRHPVPGQQPNQH